MFIKEEKGVITVWLTLLTMILISFILIINEGIRTRNSYSICKQSTKLAAKSCMANYDIDVYENYHIYVMNVTEDIEQTLKVLIKRYARALTNPNYVYEKDKIVKGIDIMGIELDDLIIKNIEYFNTDNIKKQIVSKESISDYICDNFSSYKNLYVKGYLKKSYIYEQEFLIAGKESDNENLKVVKNMLKNKLETDDMGEIICTREEYDLYIKELLMKIDENTLVNRMCELILKNINNTYDKNLDRSKLIVGIEINNRYKITNRIKIIKMVSDFMNIKSDNYKVEITSGYTY